MFYILSLMLLLGLGLKGGNEPAPTLTLYLCGISAGFLSIVRGTKKDYKISAFTWGAGLIGLWSIIEWFTSPVVYLSRLEGLQILFYCLTVLTVQQLEDEEKKRLLKLVIGIALINSLFIVGEQISSKNVQISLIGIFPSSVPGRYSGVFQNPNTAGEVAAMGLGTLLFWLAAIPRNRQALLAGSSSVAILTAATVATQSRGAILLVIGIAILGLPLQYFLTKNRQYLQAAILTLFLLLALLGLQGKSVHRLSDIKATTLSTASQLTPATGETERVEIWKSSLSLWSKEPLMGIHPGLLNERWFEVQPENIQEMPYKSHSLPITILCEYGIVGAFIGLSFLTLWLWQLCTRWALTTTTQQAATIGALVLLAGDCVDYSLYVPLHGLLFSVLVALSLPVYEAKTYKLPTQAITCVFTLFLFGYGVQQAIWCFGFSSQATTETRIDEAQNILSWMPDNAAVHQELSHLYKSQNNNKAAMQEQLTVFKLNPFDLNRTSLAYLIYPTNPQKADEIINQAIRQAPNSFIIYNVAADYYQQTGRTNQATLAKTRAKHLQQFWRKSAFKVKD